MNPVDLIVLAPALSLAAAAVLILLAIAFGASHRLCAALSLLALTLALLFLPLAVRFTPRQVTSLLKLDGFAFFYTGLLLIAGLLLLPFTYSYLRERKSQPQEFYLLYVLSMLGAVVLAASDHFVSFFLGLELLSISLYGMIAYLSPQSGADGGRLARSGLEAGLKYLILAAGASAFLLFGMALVYAERGVLSFEQLPGGGGGGLGSGVLLAGLGMMVVGVGFKLALVPFHLWTPDVYEGAPAPVTAFVATVSKGAVFALFLRLYVQMGGLSRSFFLLLPAIAIASMFAGNLLALRQRNVKRILAYSSIAHLGYLLAALLAGGERGVAGATFYLVTYVPTLLTAFGVLSLLSGHDRDADDLEDYRGLYWRRPWPAAILTLAVLSLIGIPLTAGFMGKFYVLLAGVGSARWWLVGSLVASSAIGLYYYLRIVVTMFLEEDATSGKHDLPAVPLAGSLLLALLGVVIVGIGLYPAPLLDIIHSALAGLI